MVAHHFKDMDGMFSDIYRICELGGFVLLREHQLPLNIIFNHCVCRHIAIYC